MKGLISAKGHCCKYKSAGGADGCRHVWENSEGLHTRPFLITPNFQGCISSRPPGQAVSGPYRNWHTHTHTDIRTLSSLLVVRAQLQIKKKNLNIHILLNTHNPAHASISTAPKLLRDFQTACHVSHTLVVICKCPLMAERTVYFFLNKWPHTHTQSRGLRCVFSFHWYVFPQFARLNRKRSSVCTFNGNQRLQWNALISTNVNLSGGDWRYGRPAFRKEFALFAQLMCLHWSENERLSQDVPMSTAVAAEPKPFSADIWNSSRVAQGYPHTS